MGFTDITTVDGFNDAIKNSKMAVIHFCSPTHSTCEKVDPELDELSTNQKVMDAGIVFFKVDLPLASDVVTTSKVQNPPAVQVYQDGKKVDEAQGGNLAPVKKWVEALAGLF